jgi:hypothetical protein
MKGARLYADAFRVSDQEGKLVWCIGSHARGKTFRLFVLPEGEVADWRAGKHNAPLNHAKVEVYGVVSGNPGWTEEYGWLHEGKWQDDFMAIYLRKLAEQADRERAYEQARAEREQARAEVDRKILAAY